MKQNKVLCKDGTLAHHWILNQDGLAYCKKCPAIKQFESSTLPEMNEVLHERKLDNPFMEKVSW